MKATELQIGDWVFTQSGAEKVVEIREDVVHTDEWAYNYDAIKPIPLTPEVLEKNGFIKEKNDNNMYRWNWSITSDCVSYDKGTGIVRIFHVLGGLAFVEPLEYVHELQHALRLCRIEKEVEL